MSALIDRPPSMTITCEVKLGGGSVQLTEQGARPRGDDCTLWPGVSAGSPMGAIQCANDEEPRARNQEVEIDD